MFFPLFFFFLFFDRCAWAPRYARHATARAPERFQYSVGAERCSCEKHERDVAEETMSVMVKLANEIDEPYDIDLPTAECQSRTPSEKRQVTRRDKFCFASAGTQRHACWCTWVLVLLRDCAQTAGRTRHVSGGRVGTLHTSPAYPSGAYLPSASGSPTAARAEAPSATQTTRPPWPPPQGPSEAARALPGPTLQDHPGNRGPPGHTM